MTLSDKTLDLIETLRAKGESFCVATILRTADSTSARPGAKAVITADGVLHGFVGGGCVSGAVRKGALECLDAGQPKLIRVKPKDQVVAPVDVDGVQLHRSSCPSGGTVEIFLEPICAARTLLICGASPIAQAILSLAGGLAYRVVVAAAKDDHVKMPGAADYIDGYVLDGLDLCDADAAIIATQGKRDSEALRAVLQSGAGYKGMVCSRKKRDVLQQKLVGEDAELQARFAVLNAPAGIHIGGIEPEEIAISVIAEIISDKRLGAGRRNEAEILATGTD